jgi:GT2 family glycosyltransferase
MNVGAVVITWRETTMTERAIRSLLEARPGFTEIVCIAQELTGAQLSQLRTAVGRRVDVDPVDANLGYCAAANRGLGRLLAAGCDWVMTLNNDAWIEPSCLGRCLAASSREDHVAIVGPAVAFADGSDRLWYGGGLFYSAVGLTRHRGLGASTSQPPPTALTDYVPGCCCLISTTAWQQVGAYREDYFMYYEDVEWCERARHAGWSCLYLGEVLCQHEGSATAGSRGELSLTPTSAYYLGRNSMRFAIETPNRIVRATRVAGVATLTAAHNARRLRGAAPGSGRAYAQGIRDAFTGSMGPHAAKVNRRHGRQSTR